MKEHYVSEEMILHAQQLRKDLGFTMQSVVDEAEKIGQPVSMSTVRRFFSEDATKHKFAVDTVQGILSILEQTPTEGMTAQEQLDLLKDIIAFGRTWIEELNDKISSLQNQHKNEINQMRCAHSEEIFKIVNENHQRLDFLKSTIEDFKTQLEIKDRRMDQRDTHFIQQINLKDRRYDTLLERYDELNKQYNELLAQLAKKGE